MAKGVGAKEGDIQDVSDEMASYNYAKQEIGKALDELENKFSGLMSSPETRNESYSTGLFGLRIVNNLKKYLREIDPTKAHKLSV